MILAIVSDTHMNLYNVKKVLKDIEKADVLIHLGDNVEDAVYMSQYFRGRTIYVGGNCDYGIKAKSEVIEELGGIKFLIAHGHKYGVKGGLENLKSKALKEGIQVVLYGHTHISSLKFDGGIWFINPGSLSCGRDGAESYVLLSLENTRITPELIIV